MPFFQQWTILLFFSAIDCEFTGLSIPGGCPRWGGVRLTHFALQTFLLCSLFDSGADRYAKVRRAVQTFIPSQIGLTYKWPFHWHINLVYLIRALCFCLGYQFAVLCQVKYTKPETLLPLRHSVLFDRYVAHAYNFFVYPSSFGPIDVQFTCQVGAPITADSSH